MTKFEKNLIQQAKLLGKKIAFPEAAFSQRTVAACKKLARKKICKVVLIGDESALNIFFKNLDDFVVINPKTSAYREDFEAELLSLRKEKGMTCEMAKKLILNPFYFANILLKKGFVDGVLGGAETSSADVLRPALQIIGAKKKTEKVSSCFVMVSKNKKFGENGVMLLADCGLQENPNSLELAQIAKATVSTATQIGLQVPKVAFLSHSSFKSAKGPFVEKMQNATATAKELMPNILVEGELQFDAACSPRVASIKVPSSKIAGNANILIFPSIESGNIAYKILQSTSGARALGPLTQNFAKPVNDLSRGCTADEIVMMACLTALQSNK